MEHDNEHFKQQPVLAQPETQPATFPTKLPGVIVVIPAYNEELVIGSLVLKASRQVEKVIVVDDGSPDNTAHVARLAGAEVIRLRENQGKSHALLAGLNRAREIGCAVAVTLDGDGQHKTREIPVVAQPVLDGKADLVIGSRFLGKTNSVPVHRCVEQKRPLTSSPGSVPVKPVLIPNPGSGRCRRRRSTISISLPTGMGLNPI